VIAANPELHERELAKLAPCAEAITTALRNRGVSEQLIREAVTLQAGRRVHGKS
jgi:hypothetical protein